MTVYKNSVVSGAKQRCTILCQVPRIPSLGKSTFQYVDRRLLRFQHAMHSGTTSIRLPDCGLSTSACGYVWNWYRLCSYRDCSIVLQDLGGELICIFRHSSNFLFPNLSLGHSDLYLSARLLYEAMQVDKCIIYENTLLSWSDLYEVCVRTVIPVQAIKACLSRGIAPLILNLGTRKRWAVSFMCQGYNLQYPLHTRLRGSQKQSGLLQEEKNFLPVMNRKGQSSVV